MEILDLYDDYGNKLEKTIVRGDIPRDNENIMLSIVFIKNSAGKYLIIKRKRRQLYHNRWSCNS